MVEGTSLDCWARSVNAQGVKGVRWSECMTVPQSGWWLRVTISGRR